MPALTRATHTLAGAALATAGAIAGPIAPPSADLPLQVLPLFRELEEGRTGETAVVGDSVVEWPNTWSYFFRDRAWADYANAGDGYRGFAGFDGNCEPGGNGNRCGQLATLTLGTRVSTYNGPREDDGLTSPNGYFIQLFDENGTLGRADLDFYGGQSRLHYTKRVGAGTFRIEINGKTAAVVDTSLPAGAADENHRIDVTTDAGADPDTIQAIAVESTDGVVSQINAIEMRTGQPGFIQHNWARGGVGPADYNRSNTAPNAQTIGAVGPKLVLVMLDWVGPFPKADYENQTNVLLDFYENAMPDARFILITHHPFKTGISQQVPVLRTVAQQRGHGFINLFDTFPGGFAEMDALGYMADTVHLTPAGGDWFGSYIYDLVRDAGLLALSVDYSGDNNIDFFDMLAFLDLFEAGDPSADIAMPRGSLDVFDLLRYLDLFDMAF